VPLTYQTFAEAVQSGVNAEPSFRHAAELQRVLDLCFQSNETGCAVPVIAGQSGNEGKT
jgi:predicted dehydrogenase